MNAEGEGQTVKLENRLHITEFYRILQSSKYIVSQNVSERESRRTPRTWDYAEYEITFNVTYR